MRQQGGMRFTRKAKILIDFLIELIMNDHNGSGSVAAISKKIKVHRNYIGRLLTPLKVAGYISTSTSGICRFIANPEEVTVLQIVKLVDGSASIHALFQPSNPPRNPPRHFSKIWLDMDTEIRNKLNAVTVQDLVDACVKDDADVV